MKRTFIAVFTIEGDEDTNDALVSDTSDALSGMATWLQAAIPEARDVTVYDRLVDLDLDAKEGVIHIK